MDFNRENFDLLLEKSASVETLESENVQLKMDNKQLKERIQYLLRKLFGAQLRKVEPGSNGAL